MARRRPEDRVPQLAGAALRLFSERGYRRTQIADVARELGLSPGAVYGSVRSKEALFDLAVHCAFDEMPAGSDLPLVEPPLEDLVSRVDARMRERMRTPGIVAALRAEPPADARAELDGLVRELYDSFARNARAIHLLDRCAADWPELADLYLRRGRQGLRERWQRYLSARIASGHLPPVPDAAIAARLVIETVAWFAMHRHGDPAPQPMDEASARETVVTVLRRGLCLAEDA